MCARRAVTAICHLLTWWRGRPTEKPVTPPALLAFARTTLDNALIDAARARGRRRQAGDEGGQSKPSSDSVCARLSVCGRTDGGCRFQPWLKQVGQRADPAVEGAGHRSVITVLALLVLLGFGLMQTCYLSRSPNEQGGRVRPTAATPMAAAQAKQEDPTNSRTVAEPPSVALQDAVTISVHDEHYRVVAGAQVDCIVASGRTAAIVGGIGLSDGQGALVVPLRRWDSEVEGTARRESDRVFLRISKSGFAPAFIPRQELRISATHSVLLQRGYEHRVRCVDQRGGAIAGMHVFVSLGHLPKDPGVLEALDCEAPGSAAIRMAATDSLGMAVFRGLRPGKYSLAITSGKDMGADSTWVGCSGPIMRVFTVPGPETTVTFDKAMVSVVRVIGDTIVTMNGQTTGCRRGMGFGATDDLRHRVSLKWETPLVVVGHAVPGELPLARWRVLLSRAGWIDIEDPLRPVAGLTPQVIDAARLPPAQDMGRLKFECDRIAGIADWFLERGRGVPDMSVSLRSGEVVSVPEGDYRIITHDKVLRRLLSGMTVTVSRGALSVFTVPQVDAVVVCRLHVRYPGGDPVTWAGWSVRRAGADKQDVPISVWGNDPFQILVPREDIVVDGEIMGHDPVRLELRLAGSIEPVQEATIVVRETR